ncbi:hypothetical protein BG011_005031 [Mortierella polycephala]|uniref:Uncharacterized protein n=1 Tax=Mortierella polycephala TaxID=41804 RepID=A0A9P6U1W1_9FUNG|nr:hypothetical protein BG011_005031 [Mortierella polycephala]
MVLPQESLEALLSITPELQELKLINLCKYIVHDELATLADASFEYDRQRLLDHLCALTLNQTLQSFHFSSLDDHPSEEILQETIHPKMFPKVTEWSFWSKD